jgi:hypothetical protein
VNIAADRTLPLFHCTGCGGGSRLDGRFGLDLWLRFWLRFGFGFGLGFWLRFSRRCGLFLGLSVGLRCIGAVDNLLEIFRTNSAHWTFIRGGLAFMDIAAYRTFPFFHPSGLRKVSLG